MLTTIEEPLRTTESSIERCELSVACVTALGMSRRAPAIALASGVWNRAIPPRITCDGPPVIFGRAPW